MHHSIPADHAQHDLDLIAGHAAGDLTESERTRAGVLLSSCTSCVDLRHDLVAIATATQSLPALAAAPRDFRLTPAQAATLRRAGWIKSLLRPFAAPRSTVRPMAMAFTSLGLAGLLITTILPGLFGSAASRAPATGLGGGAPASTAAAAPNEAPAASEAAPAVPVQLGPEATRTRDTGEFGPAAQPTVIADRIGSKANEATNEPEVALQGQGSATGQPYAVDRQTRLEQERIAQELNPLLGGSVILLALGIGLFGLLFLARRTR